LSTDKFDDNGNCQTKYVEELKKVQLIANDINLIELSQKQAVILVKFEEGADKIVEELFKMPVLNIDKKDIYYLKSIAQILSVFRDKSYTYLTITDQVKMAFGELLNITKDETDFFLDLIKGDPKEVFGLN